MAVILEPLNRPKDKRDGTAVLLFVVFVVKYLSSIFRYASSPNRESLNWSLPAPAKKIRATAP